MGMVISAKSFFFGTVLAPMIFRERSNGPSGSTGEGVALQGPAQRSQEQGQPNQGQESPPQPRGSGLPPQAPAPVGRRQALAFYQVSIHGSVTRGFLTQGGPAHHTS